MSATVRPVDATDFARLLERADARSRAHHQERWEMQDRGEATYLVAWRENEPCGRVTLLRRSKYSEVRELMGDFPEMNALEAVPQGEGIGSQLVSSAEDHAKAMGIPRVGLAVELENEGARRLYERLGYQEWGHGVVVDRWVERDGIGRTVRHHADACVYLVKMLRL